MRYLRIVVIMVAATLAVVGCSHRSRKHKPTAPTPLQITTTSLPAATEGVLYSATIEATGGTTPYTWSLTGLPSGLSWSRVGDKVEISGTPDNGTAGTYNVEVTVSDSSSPTQTVSATLQLVVNASGGALRADFEASPTYGQAPLTVNFTDRSTGNPTSWEWDFDGDNVVDSHDQNPSWEYKNPGWYTVRLTVSDGTDSDTCVKEMYILVANNIYYVNGVGGDDANGGTGWSDAWKTIGKALSDAGNYDLVFVADATYSKTNLNFNGKKIYLKGIGHNNAGQQPVIDCGGSGRAFYFNSGETKDCVIDNFTITNGSSDLGGAIRCENSSDPSIMNCTFSNNRALYGGGISCKSSSPSIVNCTFKGNSVDLYGGAIFCDESSSPNIVNCTFSDNSASLSGGAIWCDNLSSPALTNCVFANNLADNYYGGAIFCKNSSIPVMDGCTFTDNSADRDGGAIYCKGSSPVIWNCVFENNRAISACGGAIYCESSSPNVTGCTFSGNTANYHGGAVYCYDNSSPKVTNCMFSGNNASDRGGAIFCEKNSNPTVTNCTFSNNTANYYGGAIACDSSSPVLTNCIFSGNSVNSDGGAVYCCDSSSPTLTNCTFSGNSAANFFGGAIACYFSSSATLNNSILWGNSAGSGGNEIYIADSGSSCVLNYCCVDSTGYGFGTGVPTTTIDDSNHCVHDDPLFVNAANGDYHLQDTSPCIDAGDNTLVPSGVDTDLDGNPRIVDGNNDGTQVVDIGAYEYQP